MNSSHGGRKSVFGLEIPPINTTTNTNGAGVDMQGFDRVAFHLAIGTITNGGTVDMRAVESDYSNFNPATNVSGAAIVQIANTTANVVASIDVRPAKRYVRVVVTPATNNTTFSVVSERFRGTGVLPAALPTNHQYVTA